MTLGITLDCARPTEFMIAVERLESEHSQLTAGLTDLYLTAKSAIGTGHHPLSSLLGRLAQQSAALQSRVEEHLFWSCQELFPMVGVYSGVDARPSIGPSYWGLDKNFDLVRRDLEAFRAAVPQGDTGISREEAEETVSYLLQACVALSDLLKTEKDMLFPMAEEMLTDIDYLFS